MTVQDEESIFTLRGVSKTFKEPLTNPFRKRKGVRALVSVDMDIPGKKITCLLGPNGAGKTTLIKILASLVTSDSGEIRYRGKILDDSGKAIQGKIGLVTPNERSFYWRLTGRQNLMFFGSLHDLRGKALRERVAESLSEADMTENADKPYRLYSTGMKQKLNIARALLGYPELYLLDEPASHLDPLAREEFWSFVSGTLMKKRDATVFLCTHDLEEAKRLADYIVILDAGKITAKGTPADLHAMIDDRKELIFKYSGDLPQKWRERMGDSVRDSVQEDGPGSIRVLYDGATTGSVELIRSFVAEGGALCEAYSSEDDLLELLHRKVSGNV